MVAWWGVLGAAGWRPGQGAGIRVGKRLQEEKTGGAQAAQWGLGMSELLYFPPGPEPSSSILK